MKEKKCKPNSGILKPVVNLNKCEGKGPCIAVCPFDVFEMRAICDDDYRQLSLMGRIKTKVHGRDKAFVINPDLCHSCGLCVSACPEKAIKLETNKMMQNSRTTED